MLLSRRPDDEERAVSGYRDLCESDERVAELMKMEQLSRSGLNEIYGHLSAGEACPKSDHSESLDLHWK